MKPFTTTAKAILITFTLCLAIRADEQLPFNSSQGVLWNLCKKKSYRHYRGFV